MDYFTKNKMLFWCVIILVIINVVTLTSFWLKKPPFAPPRNVKPIPDGGKIMQQRLQLSDKQAQLFEQIRNEHFMRTRPLQDEIHKIKMDMLDELFSPDADNAQMQKMLDELAEKQKQFEENLYQHFRQLKQACTDPQQVEELKFMLRDLIESTRPRDPQRRPHRRPLPGRRPMHEPPPDRP